MKKSLFAFALIFAFASTTNALFAQKKNIKTKEIKEKEMFPAPKEGYKQVYIKVPSKKDEENYKVEIFVGKTQLVDCNSHFMGGYIETITLDGWGYNYYIVETDGNVASTMMACPDNKLTKQFVHMESKLLRYNSQLPIVIYVPQDLEVNYKIWSASKKMKSAKARSKHAEVATYQH